MKGILAVSFLDYFMPPAKCAYGSAFQSILCDIRKEAAVLLDGKMTTIVIGNLVIVGLLIIFRNRFSLGNHTDLSVVDLLRYSNVCI